MNHVPAIRFAGFTDPWEQRKVSEIMHRATVFSDDPTLPNVEYEDVVSGQGILNKDLLTKAVFKKGLLFEPGDILFGKLRPYLKNWLRPAFSGIAVGDWWVLKPDLTTPEFLYAFIQGSPFQSIANVSTGTKMPRSDWNLIANAEFGIPSEQEEQALIGSFFRDLDDLITLHQRKYDKFVVLKKALLEKMFPRDGASVPEIRFAGFTDPWKQRKLGEVADIVFRTVEIEDDKEYQLVTVKRKNAGVVQRSVVKGRDILVKNYQELQTGDFLISKRQVVHGGNGLVPPSLSGAIVSNEYLVLVGNAKISSEFWALLSMTKTMCTCYFLSSFGVDIEKLVFDVDDWKKRQIAIPTQTEQSQICSFFRDLDDLITLHQRKLTLLRNLKAACLEKMFV